MIKKMVMADKKALCPHCGKEIEAAFINDQLAMSLHCPQCGKLIEEGQMVPIET